MDFDNDGTQDIISGSYDPGDLYLFKGMGNGEYAKIEKILDENDIPLVHHPDEMTKYQAYKKEKKAGKKDSSEFVRDSEAATQWRVSSFGSWPATVDWDADGDLDMLIGTFSGQMFLRMNNGTRSEPKFAGEAIQVNAAEKPLKETGHAAPVVADWDGDGLWDLVVGSSDGSVGWYRNVGSEGAPDFIARQILVQRKATGKFLFQYVSDMEQTTPGVRAQICVTDYDLDGRLDLIVGDYKNVILTKKLSGEDQVKFDKLITKQQAFMDEITMMRQEFGEKYQEMNEDERKQAEEEIDAFGKQFDSKAFVAARKEYCVDSADDNQGEIVSNVWLYLRKDIDQKGEVVSLRSGNASE